MRPNILLVPVALLAAAVLAPVAALGPAPAALGPGPGDPLVVVAHIDVGVNPYHDAFRWDDPRAQQHPCTYIPAFPCSAIPLVLHLDEPDWETAFNLDLGVWENVGPNQLYWIKGTKIIGAISFGPDKFAILDDDGHGTMTASRSAGNFHSLCPDCLFVAIEGLGNDGVTFAADSGFVDVQTNSWGYLVPVSPGAQAAVAAAADKMPVFFASGNGIEFQGGVTQPTYFEGTAAPGVVLVGAHDNGHVLTWDGSPQHVIADGYGPWTALRDAVSEERPDPVACCTSTAAPYAAGGAAGLIFEARRILGDLSPGIVGGVVASGPAGLVPQGPLADGVFTLDELRSVLFHTATARPVAQADDGLLNWLGDPANAQLPPPGVALAGFVANPGQNPYCRLCVTTPVTWSSIPTQLPMYAREGYGAIDAPSVALAGAVLRGEVAEPARALEDTLYGVDQQVREVGLAALG
ncbi:MAG TPA: S8 family serine peptidase [Candidatus Thermoplasmatota archaeon]|jgi:subtilisin family serine protease|nr:S8 family serine peptidase [Candidatus Thermoplasmatota archaeon]